MEVEVVALLIYALTVLIPINGLIWFGMRAETKRKRNLLKAAWRLKIGGRNGK